METQNGLAGSRVLRNKGEVNCQKPLLKLPEIWAIRTRLQMYSNIRELAMFNRSINSKLRACDLTRLLGQYVCQGSHVGSRAMDMQQKSQARQDRGTLSLSTDDSNQQAQRARSRTLVIPSQFGR